MVKINLLPHREEKRRERGKAFYALLILGAVVGALIVIVGGGLLEGFIARQEQRNNVLRQENKRLDEEIKKVATLKQEIEALRARQMAVEDLQADRNQPVYLLDELVAQTPEGIFLTSLTQTGQRVVLVGYAQSNERVSEYLRNLGNHSKWLERPDLIEIKAATFGGGRDMKNVFTFTINVGIKRPRDIGATTTGKVPVAGAVAQGAPSAGLPSAPSATLPAAGGSAAAAASAAKSKR